jgi:hypothetical protein
LLVVDRNGRVKKLGAQRERDSAKHQLMPRRAAALPPKAWLHTKNPRE